MKYTVSEYARKFGYNETYVRHCCNGYIKPDTGWRYRLRAGHIPRLEGPGTDRWVIYVGGEQDGSLPQLPATPATAMRTLKNAEELIDGLSSCVKAAKFSGQSIKVQIEIHPDGSWTSAHFEERSNPLRELRAGTKAFAPDSVEELLEAIHRAELSHRQSASESQQQMPGKSVLNDILQQSWVRNHPAFETVRSICFQCHAPLGNKRKQARFCSTSCKNKHQSAGK